MGNFAVSMGRPQATKLSASGEGFTPHQGFCHWSPLGVLPPDLHNSQSHWWCDQRS